MTTPKAVRITFLGKPLRTVYPHATAWQVAKYRFFKALRWFIIRAGIAVLAFTALSVAYFYGMNAAPTMTAINTIQIVTQNEIAPILKKICMAESGCKQFTKNGLPVMYANTNGSVDIGKYQINSRVWGTKAKELGYDLLSEKGNEAMATWILENRGTSPWISSSKNWE